MANTTRIHWRWCLLVGVGRNQLVVIIPEMFLCSRSRMEPSFGMTTEPTSTFDLVMAELPLVTLWPEKAGGDSFDRVSIKLTQENAETLIQNGLYGMTQRSFTITFDALRCQPVLASREPGSSTLSIHLAPVVIQSRMTKQLGCLK